MTRPGSRTLRTKSPLPNAWGNLTLRARAYSSRMHVIKGGMVPYTSGRSLTPLSGLTANIIFHVLTVMAG